MAGHGPAPKDPSTRARTNSDPVGRTTVVRDGQLRGPGLPEDMTWGARTLAWWQTWREAPQAATFEATDWQFLLETARLHTKFWSGDDKVAAELRLRVAKFGATAEDRARLRMDIVDPVTDEPVKPEGSRGRYGHLRSVGGSA